MADTKDRILTGRPEPREVFRFFETLAAIPHGSGHEKAVSDYCAAFARARGFAVTQDVHSNLIIRKGGSAGYEAARPVILQGHLDMVCEKEPACGIDFLHDGLKLRYEDGFVFAEGTTLGGDDGIAVAYILAILDADDIPHPPIEAVLTTGEETGMTGASVLDVSGLRGRMMLNIDSEEEGVLLLSCAGGVMAACSLPVERDDAETVRTDEASAGGRAVLTVSGCLGGHSGTEIHWGRANAVRILGRALRELFEAAPYRILSIRGGEKDNAIPTEASAVLLSEEVSFGSDGILAKRIRLFEQSCRRQYAKTDPDIKVTLKAETDQDTAAVLQPLTQDSAQRLIEALCVLPDGVQKMSDDIDGLVQTSLNLGILRTTSREAVLSFAVRSSVEREKAELVGRMRAQMQSLGGDVQLSGDYPAWEYQKISPLRDLMVSVFEEQYGEKPVLQAIHAGVECGIFAGKLPGLDCVSFGPDILDIHTPRERMDIESVQRTWSLLLEVLRRLK